MELPLGIGRDKTFGDGFVFYVGEMAGSISLLVVYKGDI